MEPSALAAGASRVQRGGASVLPVPLCEEWMDELL